MSSDVDQCTSLTSVLFVPLIFILIFYSGYLGIKYLVSRLT